MQQFMPKKPEKDVITMRIPVDTLRELEAMAARYDLSRNELINQCVRYALDHMNREAQP
ncbi:MAG: ribbon-helix-helix domain-containing protein [Oscillospiraceae bacterium]|nr:ribbon-helix-helix domain-containing protein [Oscillospiraceae bacterium]